MGEWRAAQQQELGKIGNDVATAEAKLAQNTQELSANMMNITTNNAELGKASIPWNAANAELKSAEEALDAAKLKLNVSLFTPFQFVSH